MFKQLLQIVLIGSMLIGCSSEPSTCFTPPVGGGQSHPEGLYRETITVYYNTCNTPYGSFFVEDVYVGSNSISDASPDVQCFVTGQLYYPNICTTEFSETCTDGTGFAGKVENPAKGHFVMIGTILLSNGCRANVVINYQKL